MWSRSIHFATLMSDFIWEYVNTEDNCRHSQQLKTGHSFRFYFLILVSAASIHIVRRRRRRSHSKSREQRIDTMWQRTWKRKRIPRAQRKITHAIRSAHHYICVFSKTSMHYRTNERKKEKLLYCISVSMSFSRLRRSLSFMHSIFEQPRERIFGRRYWSVEKPWERVGFSARWAWNSGASSIVFCDICSFDIFVGVASRGKK